jgi:alpha-beta hydrolase superfamily lysophospholipase
MADLDGQPHWSENEDGTRLFYRTIAAPEERFRVVVSHGLGEHSGRYGHVAGCLVPMGASLWIPDHRGHGQSTGKRGHVNDFSDYVNDLKRVVDLAARDNPGNLPILMLGHSMGGLIAILFAGRYSASIDGLMLSSPLLGLPSPPSRLMRTVAGILSAIWPTFSMDNNLDPTAISHDRHEVDRYMQDQRVHSRISARWCICCMAAMTSAAQSPGTVRVPVLMQVAGADRLVSAASALDYFETLTVADKSLCHYENLFHEIYNERLPDREKVLADLKHWIAERYL